MHSAWHPVGSPHIILLFQTGGQERPLRRDLNEVKGYLLEDQERIIPNSGAWESYSMFKNLEASVAQQSKEESRGDTSPASCPPNPLAFVPCQVSGDCGTNLPPRGS